MKLFSFSILFLLLISLPLESRPFFSFLPSKQNLEDSQHHKFSKQNGVSGDFFRLKLAEEKLEEKNEVAALKIAGTVQTKIFDFWKRVIQAETYVVLKKPKMALPFLRSFPALPDPEISFGESAYKNIYARGLWAKLQAKELLHQDSSEELALLSAIIIVDKDFEKFINTKKLSPLLNPWKIYRLHNLHFHYQYQKIPGLITENEILNAKVSRFETCQALYELGDALKGKREFQQQAISALKTVIKKGCPEKFAAKSLYRLGKLGASLKDEVLTKNYFTKLYTTYPQNRLADDALYHLHKFYEKQNNTNLSNHYSKKLLDFKRGDMRDELLFEWGYAEFKKKNYQNAAKIFKKTFDGEPTHGETYPRNFYWYVRALELSSRENYQNNYQQLVREFPFSFYAVLASNRIKMPLPFSLPELKGTPPETDPEIFDAISLLNKERHHGAARAILDLALHDHPEYLKTNKEYLAKVLIASQNYRKAIDLASEHFDSGVYGPTKPTADPMFSAFYPQVYEQQLKESYQNFSLPKGSIEGIMREESLFQKEAVSWVGATGLMQLMPGTARLLQKQLPNGNEFQDLTDPKQNIFLGTTYFSKMKSDFNEQLPLAIMAYNAGPGNVRKWLKRLKNGTVELDEFIEDIPFQETRGYVKRVLRTMSVYGRLYKDSFFKKPFLDFKIKQ